jgi:hypothetical protein
MVPGPTQPEVERAIPARARAERPSSPFGHLYCPSCTSPSAAMSGTARASYSPPAAASGIARALHCRRLLDPCHPSSTALCRRQLTPTAPPELHTPSTAASRAARSHRHLDCHELRACTAKALHMCELLVVAHGRAPQARLHNITRRRTIGVKNGGRGRGRRHVGSTKGRIVI